MASQLVGARGGTIVIIRSDPGTQARDARSTLPGADQQAESPVNASKIFFAYSIATELSGHGIARDLGFESQPRAMR